jgi:hypothetical protein
MRSGLLKYPEAATSEFHTLQARSRENLTLHLSQCTPLRTDSKSLEEDLCHLATRKQPISKPLQLHFTKTSSYTHGLALDSTFAGPDLAGLVCEATIRDLHSIFHGIFCTNLTGINSDPIRHLLSKVWPLRCWSRRFDAVTDRYMKADPQINILVNRMLLCSLLGNYQHLKEDRCRPGLELRKRLYDTFDGQGRVREFKKEERVKIRAKLISRVPKMYQHAMQQYVCRIVRSNPSLLRHVKSLMKFDEFEQLISDVNDKIRQLVVDEGLETKKFIRKSNAIIKEYVPLILKTSYHKPKPLFLDYLIELRSSVKPDAKDWVSRYKPDHVLTLHKRPKYIKPSTLLSKKNKILVDDSKAAEEQEDAEEDEKKRAVLQKKRANEMLLDDAPMLLSLDGDIDVRSMADVIDNLVGVNRKQQKPETKTILVTFMQITMHHSEALEQLISRFDTTRTSSDHVLDAFLECMPAFGCPPSCVQAVRSLETDYKNLQLSKESWRVKMQEFNNRFPQAYCLLQALRRLYNRRKNIQVYNLPSSVAKAQIESLRNQFGLCKDSPVPLECAYFSFCGVCHQINSLVQSHKNSHKQNYTDGKRHVCSDLDTGQ